MWGLVDAHPDSLRALPHTLATTGIREGEAFAISEDEIDEDRGLLHVRRQIKSAGRGRGWCYGLPKNDRERDVPLSRSTAEVLRAHIARYPSEPVTLPWEAADGPLRTHRLVFLHPETGEHLTSRRYDPYWDRGLRAVGKQREPELAAAELAERVVEIRRRAGLTPAQVASELGMRPATVRAWFAARRGVPAGHLVPLLTVLKATAEETDALTTVRRQAQRRQKSGDGRHALRH